MPLYIPGERRTQPVPTKPSAHLSFWLLLVPLVLLALAGWGLAGLLSRSAPVVVSETTSVATPPTLDALLTQQDQLEQDIDALLERLNLTVSGALLPRWGEWRRIHGDGRFLRALPDWLRATSATLPPDVAAQIASLQQRWEALQQELSRLGSSARPR